ncbi:2-dehydro-3-deoxy-phosphogluconate aldolase [Aliidongia dinghuensis]|uniref:2-dehydro-3-deoxy-phosphogluconate aldolase n=1 Tax=Aliidongia dinghuensis TaxID=1867774 RepID=A0A8J2YSH5_9PROT|nr:bifunctional 4-hydroxy-2-oxoglutarate aldolase/2-dehydro-3-deoxy-phosphogluconate aldolase [Aliidongia dinghuensis]GGF13945.1 2-dehydro-3-deoxy-phosphogluconate aldolase [Aliidongia dinghuensis]
MPQPFDHTPVIPVLTIERVEDAIPLATALIEGGLNALEVTLRTPSALGVIEKIARDLPHALVGAGTVLRTADVTAAKNAGAKFLVSPGLTQSLAAAGIASGLPYLPGAVTPSEVMIAREFGFSFLKFFPAKEYGGVAMLKAWAPIFPGIEFCPTGGVSEANAAEYLALPNVPVVGGTWVANAEAIRSGDWAGIRERALRASKLRPPR